MERVLRPNHPAGSTMNGDELAMLGRIHRGNLQAFVPKQRYRIENYDYYS
jgi:hypothetical protein